MRLNLGNIYFELQAKNDMEVIFWQIWGVLHIVIVNLFNFDAVVIKFTISNNKVLKLCNYQGNVRYPRVKTFNKTSP